MQLCVSNTPAGTSTSWYKVLFVPLHLRLIPTSYPPGKATAQPHRTGSPGEHRQPSLPSLPSSRQGCWWKKLATLWTPTVLGLKSESGLDTHPEPPPSNPAFSNILTSQGIPTHCQIPVVSRYARCCGRGIKIGKL